MMMSLMILTSLMIPYLSPMKMAMFLTTLSLCTATLMYTSTQSSFVSSALVISFSSGMMILFSFCSMMSLSENKNKSTTLMITMWATMATLSEKPLNLCKNSENLMTSTLTQKGVFLVIMMTVVILIMGAVNTSMFSPSKKLTEMF